MMLYIHERDIFTNFWYDNSIFIGSYIDREADSRDILVKISCSELWHFTLGFLHLLIENPLSAFFSGILGTFLICDMCICEPSFDSYFFLFELFWHEYSSGKCAVC